MDERNLDYSCSQLEGAPSHASSSPDYHREVSRRVDAILLLATELKYLVELREQDLEAFQALKDAVELKGLPSP